MYKTKCMQTECFSKAVIQISEIRMVRHVKIYLHITNDMIFHCWRHSEHSCLTSYRTFFYFLYAYALHVPRSYKTPLFRTSLKKLRSLKFQLYIDNLLSEYMIFARGEYNQIDVVPFEMHIKKEKRKNP